MRGIVLAGGKATRLSPVTQTTSKQLLPIYNKQMIFYPLSTLVEAGITDILIIVSPEYAGQFLSLLGPMFDKSGVRLSFKVQPSPRGLADAFILGADFIGEDNVVLVLGDNIFEDSFKGCLEAAGCRIFLKQVRHPERYGVAQVADGRIRRIVEKPIDFISDLAVTGLYVFPPDVVSLARGLSPSARGEIEIADLINQYIEAGAVDYSVLKGAWFDAGNFDDWLDANVYVRYSGMYRRLDK